jgi:anion-transporting  ArsA/GET3 family ATPase
VGRPPEGRGPHPPRRLTAEGRLNAPDLITDLASRTVLVVSGKGGVGKTAVAAALASLAAREGRSVLLVSTDGRGDAPALFGREDRGYSESTLAENLRAITTDFDSLLTDFVLAATPMRLIGERILALPAFRFFTRATPGLPDLLLLGKIREVLKRTRNTQKEPRYDLVVLDAPATGHALSLLALPRTILKTVPAGPLRKLAGDVDALFSDAARTALVAVAEPAELAAKETEELVAGAKGAAGVATALVVVNRVGRGGREEILLRRETGVPLVEIPEIEPDGNEDIEDIEKISSNGPVREAAGERAGQAAAQAPQFFETFLTTFEENLQTRGPKRAAGTKPAARAAARDPLGKSSSLSFFPPNQPHLDLRPWLDAEKLIVLSGAGGVGKTTLSAAVGLAAARRGRRALVLTVDPARRLAQALGLEDADTRGGEPVAVRVPGLPRGGKLLALQIDPKATFERLLARVASPDALSRIHGNRLYTGLVDSLPGVLEYMGVEALQEHAADPEIDLVVLDTPPASRGLDFLAAPGRMVELLENDALRFFLRSDGLLGKALSGASRGGAAVLRAADSVLGFGFLADLADFFRAFDGLYDGFRTRSAETARLLEKGRFLVASSTDASALRTADEVAAKLAARGASPGLVLNRVAERHRRALALPSALAALPALALHESAVPSGDLPSALADALVP